MSFPEFTMEENAAKWAKHNHFWHYYNFSYPFPSWIPHLRSTINFLQAFPIIFGLSITINRSSNEVITSIQMLSNWIIFLDFSPLPVTVVAIFLLSLTMLCLLIAGYTIKYLILNTYFSIALHFLVDEVLPITVFWPFSILTSLIQNFTNDSTHIFLLILHCLSIPLIITLFTIKTTFQAKELMLNLNFFSSWDNWKNFISYFFASLIPLITLIKNDAIMHYTYYSCCILYSILNLFLDYNQNFVQPIINILAISVTFSLPITSILSIICYATESYPETVNFFLVIGIFVFSPVLGIFHYTRKCVKFKNLMKKSTKTDKNNENEIELNNLDEADEINAYGFSNEITQNKISISILRQQATINPKSTLPFAEFVFSHTHNKIIKAEAMRFLIILQSTNKQILSEILKINYREYPFTCRQLICDIQLYIAGLDPSLPHVQPYITKLNDTYKIIVKCLLSISEDIQTENKEDAFEKINIYSNAMKLFQNQALLAVQYSPNSPSLARLISNFYIYLKGDFNQGQIWKSRADYLESSSSIYTTNFLKFGISFSPNHQRENNFLGSSKMNDAFDKNKLKNQDGLSKVKSKALINSIIIFITLSLFIFLIIFYKIEIPNFRSLFSPNFIESSKKLPTSLIAPIEWMSLFMLNLLFSSDVIYPYDSIFHPLIIDTVQNITSMLLSLPQTDKNAMNAHNIWLNNQNSINISVQHLLLQLCGLMKLIPTLEFEDSLLYMNNYFNIYSVLYQPVSLMRGRIFDLILNTATNQQIFSFVYFAAIALVIIFLMCLILFYMLKQTETEKAIFWKSFLDFDSKSIDMLHSTLQDKAIEKFHSSPSVFSEDTLLAPEEIEFTYSEIFVPHQTQFTKEEIATTKPFCFCFTTKKSLLICSAIFILLLLVLIIMYNGLACYYINRYMDFQSNGEYYYSTVVDIAQYGLVTVMNIFNMFFNSFDNVLNATALVPDFCYDCLISTNDESEIILKDNITNVVKMIQGNSTYWIEGGLQFDTYFLNIVDVAVIGGMEQYVIIDSWKGDKFNELEKTLLSISISISVFIFITYLIYLATFILFLNHYFMLFRSLKSIILVFPSTNFSTISNIIHLFMYKSSNNNKNDGKDSIESIKLQSRYIFKQSVDSIIVIDGNYIIQDINNSTEELIGLKKDELIGSNFSRYIENLETKRGNEGTESPTGFDFFQHISFYRTQQEYSSSTPKFNLCLKKFNGEKIPISCTLIPINKHNTDNDEPAFALVLSDRTKFTLQENKLQETKRNIESLLYRLLPRVMAKKLLSHNPVLHSKVERASITFISIVNFLELCKLHTHIELMEELDIIFSLFDQNISKFPTLVKLKVINGTYMAAGELFNEVSNKSFSLEIVEFAIMCAKSVAQRNAQVGSNLQLTIGINTGGPIIAGILGSDKPLFDIWGDAVNISSRLQTSCPHNHIQMSKETYDDLPPGMFDIKKREGVFLKGKGYTTTYILSLEDIMNEHNDHSDQN